MKRLSTLFVLLIVLACTKTDLAYSSGPTQNPLSPDQISSTVNQVTEVLNENYVYPDTALKMQEYVDQQNTAGKYGDANTLPELIARIQSDLRNVSGDGHISVLLAKDTAVKTKRIKTDRHKKIQASFVSQSAAAQKIAYLRFDMFRGDVDTRNDLITAMKKLSTSDALIIDLRENIGGDPNLVALLSSYFLENDTHLWSVFDRNGNEVIEVRSNTSPHRFSGKLCILTSNKTYSAAEAFAYTLKHLGRACIVGEATGGGAHLVEMMRVNDEINLWTPTARAYNSVTESNWEGTGVIPTIEVEASKAKTAAIDFLSMED